MFSPRVAAPLIAVAVGIGCVAARPARAPTEKIDSLMTYPFARRDDVVDVLHGTRVFDPYRWLENGQSPEVISWAEAQDNLAAKKLANLASLPIFRNRLRELYAIDEVTPLAVAAGRLFLSRRSATQGRAVVVERDVQSGSERVILDPNLWPDKSLSVRDFTVSYDGKHAVFGVARNNSDAVELRTLETASGQTAATEVIEDLFDSRSAWRHDSAGFYYRSSGGTGTTSERVGRSELRMHLLGVSPSSDRVVRQGTGSASRYEEISTFGTSPLIILREFIGERQTNAFFADASSAALRWTPISSQDGVHVDVRVHDQEMFVRTDEGAPKGRIFAVSPQRPSRGAWTEIIPEHADATIADYRIVGRKLVLSLLEGAASHLEVYDLTGANQASLATGTVGTISNLVGDETADKAYLSFTSYATPAELWVLDAIKVTVNVVQRPHGRIEPGAYVTEQFVATSKDGTRVPYLLTHRRSVARASASPTVLYGYGGFGVTTTPEFVPNIVAWVDAGGIYVDALVRGGGEYGEEWHKAGAGIHKQNVIDDYISVAEHLIRDGWTTPSLLVARGGSNGALLAGAAIVQRPELFAAAVLSVPVLDMVRYPRFGAGETWTEEYGSPNNPAEFHALLSYSPYHRVRSGIRYPAVLLRTADSDDRVDAMHARKFAAALQYATTGGPVLLRVQARAGHGGAAEVTSEVDSLAESDAFALSCLGVHP